MNIIRAIKKNKLWALLCLAGLLLSIFSFHIYFAGSQLEFLDKLEDVSGVLESIEEDTFSEEYIFKLNGNPEMEYCIKEVFDVNYSKISEIKSGQSMNFKAVLLDEFQCGDVYQLEVDGTELISLEDAVEAEESNVHYALILGIVTLISFIIAVWLLIKG